MPGQTANLTSLDALRNFRAALVKFASDVEAALVTLELEARRPVEWIEDDRSRYWPQQARKASDLVSEARLALERREVRISGEDARYCYDERKALEKAKRRLQFAEEKTQATRRWRAQMHKETEEFDVQIAKLKRYLESDLVRAIATLDRMSAALDRYVEPGRRPQEPNGGTGRQTAREQAKGSAGE
jgi:hypothetical protein